MLHYQLTFEERRQINYIDRADFDARPTLLCRTGDGHAEGTRDWFMVDCPRCLAAKPKSYRQQIAHDFAQRIKRLGFRVWMAEKGTYGFVSDDTGARVLSFSAEDQGSLGGNYGPPSHESGTGWRLEATPESLRTAEDVRKALNEYPPSWCGKGWKHLTTVEQHLAQYGASSRYVEVSE